MASTYTTSLGLEIQATGENRASWGSRTNTNLALLEEAISTLKTVAMANANVTLTKLSAATDQSRPMFLRFTGAHTAIRTVTIPTVSKLYFMQNNTTGGFALTISTGSSTYSLPPGQWKLIFTDGATLWTSDNLYSASSATRRWDILGAVDAAGIMEVGRYIDFHNANADATDFAVRLETGATTTDLYITPFGSTGKKIWHSGNDGAASGLDADLLDGFHASQIIMVEPANDGRTYSRTTSGGVSSWVLTGSAPVGAGVDYWGTTAPAGWLFCYGQSLLRTTYAALFAAIGTTFGAVDGTHFSLPDKRGRASFGKDNMGGASASRLTGGLSGGFESGAVNLGDVGGAQSHTLSTAQLASHVHHVYGDTGTVSADHSHFVSGVTDAQGAHTHAVRGSTADNGNAGANAMTDPGNYWGNFSTESSGTHQHNWSAQTGGISANHTHLANFNSQPAGSGAAHNNVPPGIVCNYIIYAGV